MEQLIVHGEDDDQGRFVVSVAGVLDATTTPELERIVRGFDRSTDVFDLRFISLFTAAGVSLLLELADGRGCEIVASTVVERVLDVVGLTDVFPCRRPTRAPCFDRAEFGVATYDSSLHFTYVNDVMAGLNGLDRQQHVGRRPDEIFVLDPARDDVGPLLKEALVSGSQRDVVVTGATPTHTGTWVCRIRSGRYDGTDGIEKALLVTVVQMLADDDSASCQLVFSPAS